MPQALRVLRAHLGEGNNANPDAWRAALKVFEHAFGSPPGEIEEVRMPRSVDEVDQLSWDELLRALEYIQDDELASSAIASPKALPLRTVGAGSILTP